MEEKKKKHYNVTIDILRIIAIVTVVLIHTSSKTIEASHFDIQHFPLTLFLNQIARFAVSLFFMISGFVLELNYNFHDNYWSYVKKRFNRIFLPYLFWSAIYFFIVYPKPHGNYFHSLRVGSASYQLYFIPTLLVFYAVFPIIHKYYKFFANKWIFALLGISQLILLYLNYHVKPFYHEESTNVLVLNYFTFLLGIVASHHEKRIATLSKHWRWVLVGLTIVLGMTVYLQGKMLYLKNHNFQAIYSQWRPTVFIYTVSLATTMYAFLSTQTFTNPLIKTFSKLSFFVFFVHIIFIEYFWRWFGANLFTQTQGKLEQQLWYDPLLFICVAGLSFLLAAIVHKIPYVSKVTG